MGSELDPFDDILLEPAVTKARAGGRFLPKAKPRPKKELSASVPSAPPNDTNQMPVTVASTGSNTTQTVQPVDSINDKLIDPVGLTITSSNLLETKEPLKNIEDSSLEVRSDDSRTSKLVNSSSQLVGIGEGVGSTNALPQKIGTYDSSINRCSSLEKSASKEDSFGYDMEPFDDILPERATTNARGFGKFKPKAKPRAGKDVPEILHSIPPNATGDGSVSLAKTTKPVPLLDSTNDELEDPLVSSLPTSETIGSKMPLKDNEGTFIDNNTSSGLGNSSSRLGAMRQDVVSTDAMLLEVATSAGNGNWDSSLGTSAGKEDSMGFVLDPFSDILPEPATSNARAGGKFRPKVKPRPRKETYASDTSSLPNATKEKLVKLTPTSSGTKLSSQHVDGSSLVTSDIPKKDIPGSEEPLESYGVPFSGVSFSDDPRSLGLENPSSQIVATDAMHLEVPNSDGNEDWHSSSRKFAGENADIFSGLEYLDDFLSQPTTSKETSTMHVSNAEGATGVPVISSVEHREATQIHSDMEAVSNNDRDFHINNGRLETELRQAGILGTDGMIEGSIPSIPLDDVFDFLVQKDSADPVETLISDAAIPGEVVHSEAASGITRKVSAKKRKNTSTTSDISQKPQTSTTAGEDIEDGGPSRRLRKRAADRNLVHESEEGGHDGGSPAESPPNSVRAEDDVNDGEYRMENTSGKKRVPRKSKKAEPANERPVRKRKKVNEVPDESTKKPPKRFSHSTRRNKRCVDKDLLEILDDADGRRNLPIKQLIMLAEYKERISNKEASTSTTPLPNQNAENYSPQDAFDNEREDLASDEDRDSNDDLAGSPVQLSSSYFNYHSYMDRTPRTRWSKQDNETFYEAVRQFGTDFSMIQQLFPGRTRNQIKLKFKKEERQHPLMLTDAVQNRSKDHSQFELVIEKLRQAAQAEQDLNRDDSIDLTGEENEVENATPETNEEVAKSEQKKEEEDAHNGTMDADNNAELQVPAKLDESDDDDDGDDDDRWNSYQSAL